MSSFSVTARRVTVLPHGNADALEIAQVDGTEFVSVVRKGAFESGDLAVYIPEAAVVPQPVLEDLGLWGVERKGKIIGALAGPDGRRVKAIRLRGVLSQGLVHRPAGLDLAEGADYAEALGITKWEPPIPTSLSGEAVAVADLRSYTDIENIKNFPDALSDGEDVIMTEKLHGSCMICSLIDGEFRVSSKGLAGKGLALLPGEGPDGQAANAYWRAAQAAGVEAAVRGIAARSGASEVTVFGELLGVQDLMYGQAKGQLGFRAFDVRLDGAYADHAHFEALMSQAGLDCCPVLYRGPFSRRAAEEAASGPETVTGSEAHIREGVVVRPAAERQDPALGRVILKCISPAYLLRHGGTEYE